MQAYRNLVLIDEVDMKLQLANLLVRRCRCGPIHFEIVVEAFLVSSLCNLRAESFFQSSVVLSKKSLG